MPQDKAAIVVSVDAEKINALTHRQRVEIMARVEQMCEEIGSELVLRWDTEGFELPGAFWP